MSQAADAWLALPVAERRYGESHGTPAWCVKYVTCPICKAKPGQLCTYRMGPALGHHWGRGGAYLSAKKRGDAPAQPCEVTRLRQRVRALELQVKILQQEADRLTIRDYYYRGD